MPIEKRISFTALPNGVVDTPQGKKVRLSVFVSPRLTTNPPSTAEIDLGDYGEWANWPDTAVTFEVKFGGGPAVAATPVGDPPVAALWGMLFTGTTKLVPHAFDTALSQSKIPITYPVKAVHQKIRDIYTHFAKSNPETFPTVTQILASPLGELVEGFLPVKKPVSDVPEGPAIAQGGVLAAPLAVSQAQKDFQKVSDFHKPFNPDVRVTPAPPEIDFHQMLSALGRYPFLMRMLGIVRDLEAVHPGPGAEGNTTVEVVASWSGKASSIVPAVHTHCVLSGTAFYARPRAVSPDLSTDGLGMLRFDDTNEYDLVQVNRTVAVLKTLDFAASVVHATFSINDPLNYPAYVAVPGSTQLRRRPPKSYKTDEHRCRTRSRRRARSASRSRAPTVRRRPRTASSRRRRRPPIS